MKIVLFVGELIPQGLELLDYLKEQGFQCIKSQNPDEIDQVGQQCSKAILVFNDPKFAFRFLVENKWPAFPVMNVLYLAQQPKTNPDVEQKLAKVSLTIYTPASKDKLLAKMNAFQNSTETDNLIDNLEFSINDELGKEE